MRMMRESCRGGAYECSDSSVGSWLADVSRLVLAHRNAIGSVHAAASVVRPCWWEAKASPTNVFPLPMPSQIRLPKRGRGRLRARRRRDGAPLMDVWVCILNSMYAGRCGEVVCSSLPSMAQIRCLERLQALHRSFLRDLPEVSGEDVLTKYLQSGDCSYGNSVARPLGLSAGVPPVTGDVALADVLEASHPQLAAQVRDPEQLLLSESEWPEALPFVRSLLARDYSDFVDRNVEVGLQDLVDASEVAVFRGKPIIAAAFAVGKSDSTENRMISGVVGTNSLINPALLPRPRYAHIPRMRVCTVDRHVKVRISKRDARHYFHRLKLGSKWRRFLAHPPVWRQGVQKFPRHTCAGMGLAPSSGWAQALTDQTTTAACLPEDQRILIDKPAPIKPPFWGSIVDDVWCVDTDDKPMGQEWCQRVHVEWERRGVEPHAGKVVDEVEGTEIQGVFVHPTQHWVGASMEKRSLLMRGLWRVLGQWKPRVKQVDRLVGKLGFMMSFNVATRSLLVDTFSWLCLYRGRSARAVLWPTVFDELLQCMFMLPFMDFSLSKPWCPRVEAADASPGGHGRAWTLFPESLVQDLARLSDHKGAYTNMSLPFGIETTGDEVCPLHRTHWPVKEFSWLLAGRPGGHRNIVLEELAAQCWSIEERLKRPNDFGTRILQGCDSASGTGALLKGRSPSRAVNRMCQKFAALCLGGNLTAFISWLPTAVNPSDEPSSWYGVRARNSPQPQAKREQSSSASTTSASQYTRPVVLHLCSGPRREGYFHERTVAWCKQFGLDVEVLSIDPIIDDKLDLMDLDLVRRLEGMIEAGLVRGVLAGPPCSTWSSARHKPLGPRGPRPLRSRAHPWKFLPNLSVKEQQAHDVGSYLAITCLRLIGMAACKGAWVLLEHPADKGYAPFPSLFATAQVKILEKTLNMVRHKFDQCMFGCQHRKATEVLSNDVEGKVYFTARCCHISHLPAIGLKGKQFLTAGLAAYPARLCDVLAWRCALAVCVSEFQPPVVQHAWNPPGRSAGVFVRHPPAKQSTPVPGGARILQG